MTSRCSPSLIWNHGFPHQEHHHHGHQPSSAAHPGPGGLGVVATGNLTDVFGSAYAGAAGRDKGRGKGAGPGDGTLQPDPAGLLDLPPGFRYTIVPREGDP